MKTSYLHHLFHRVGQRDGDGEWKAFRHCDNEHCHANNDEMDELLQVETGVPGLLLDVVGVDGELHEENQNRQHGDYGAWGQRKENELTNQ